MRPLAQACGAAGPAVGPAGSRRPAQRCRRGRPCRPQHSGMAASAANTSGQTGAFIGAGIGASWSTSAQWLLVADLQRLSLRADFRATTITVHETLNAANSAFHPTCRSPVHVRGLLFAVGLFMVLWLGSHHAAADARTPRRPPLSASGLGSPLKQATTVAWLGAARSARRSPSAAITPRCARSAWSQTGPSRADDLLPVRCPASWAPAPSPCR
jgi:hypothetical protein